MKASKDVPGLAPGQPAWGAVRGWGVLTPWGQGLACVPDRLSAADAGQRILPVVTPHLESERLRRATRECLLGVAVVAAALEHAQLTPEALAGPRTGLVFASASSYVAANWAFLSSGTENALHFPYTAPSAVPGEVSIQFGITGPYMTLLSGANAGIEALWQAATLLETAQCDRVLVLGVETFQECAALYTTGRWLLGTPLTEVATCLILERHPSLTGVRYHAARGEHGLCHVLQAASASAGAEMTLCMPTRRAGQQVVSSLKAGWPSLPLTLLHERCGMCLASAPLMALMLAMTAQVSSDTLYLSRWWDAWALLRWPGAVHG